MKTFIAALAFSLVTFSALAERDERPREYEEPPKIEQPAPDTITNTATGGDSASSASSSIEGDDINFVAVRDDWIDLASHPVAVCQGASTSVSAGGRDGLIGGALGIGRSGVDKQCTLRANIAIVQAVSGDKDLIFKMMLQLDGMEHLWHIDQHPDCKEWLIENDEKAHENGCKWPRVKTVDEAAKKTLALAR